VKFNWNFGDSLKREKPFEENGIYRGDERPLDSEN
jgi:hypothetical protein